MIELRYNGCPGCLESAKSLMTAFGYFNGKDYRVEFHAEHRDDAIYKARPDYLELFNGAILYNPKNGSWIDFYPSDSGIIDNTEGNKKTVQTFMRG